MGEHQNHTQFLRQCLRYDDSSQRHELEKTFSQLQRDLRCVRRATWLMAVLATLAVAGLGYAAVFTDNFPYNLPPFILNLICTLAVGSLISLLAFMGLGMVYCRAVGPAARGMSSVGRQTVGVPLGPASRCFLAGKSNSNWRGS